MYRPTLTAIYQSWSDDSFVQFVLQLNRDLSQIITDNPLQEFHADCTLLSTSAPHLPVASIVEPKYWNELVHGIGTPAKQTSSLDPAGLKYSVFFLLI